MAKRTKTKTTAVEKSEQRAQPPAFLESYGAEGIEGTADYQQTPVLKTIQAQTGEELQDEFGVGSVGVGPDNVLVAETGEPFVASPVFWWPSWQTWADIDDGPNGPIFETMNPNHPVAIKSKSKESRNEVYPDDPGKFYTHAESLNFVLAITDGPAKGFIAVARFQRGGHGVGRRLCGFLARQGLAIFAHRLSFRTDRTKNSAGQTWYQLDWKPADPPYITSEEEAQFLKDLRDQIKRAHEAGQMKLSDAPAPEAAATDDSRSQPLDA